MTSFKAVLEVKKLFATKKAGHTGTLDPDVDGVLPVCLGRGTKIVEYLTAQRKTYAGEVTLGYSTTTEDASGETVEQKEVDRPITTEEVENLLHSLKGDIKQTPPMYSAVKVNGKKLYEYAREGKTIDRPERTVTIYSINLTSNIETTEDNLVRFQFEVTCSKGTYIRTLSVMIGEMLGYPAHMSKLTRTQSGSFHEGDCFTFDELNELQDQGKLHESLLSLEYALKEYPTEIIDDETEKKVRNGAILPQTKKIMDEPLLALYNRHGECLALYEKHSKRHGMMKPAKMLITND
ncbi:tRNA pseudouridine(55) synthase TruB [Bacillus shivajii]|uniref:tRNA pseudouridine(55) synthase TruB n=1 Tax=Bacillus shivajii TaxID=1983719 RepID=UPI0021F60435|nr:tRNA pseudouridine(55) synthase TruB [Bacillus shivajii]